MKRTILILAYDDAELLDISGPASAFANAGAGHYDVSIAAPRRGAVRTSSGVVLHATYALARAPRRIDTLLVAGGEGTRAVLADAAFLAGLRRLAGRARRVASVCSGAFLLAAAGLLDGRRATTHWKHAALMARMFPRVQVEPDAIFVRDGAVWTSAGVSAGIDLALALVEDDLGREAALAVARELVVFLKRPGGQTQFSMPLAAQASERPLLERIRQQVLERPQQAWSVAAMAERAHVSERHLRRLFVQDLAIGPREFVTRVRLEHAQRLLSDSRLRLSEVARRCGYATAEAFGRRFEASFGVSPGAWRQRFRAH
jgi:transcriptional regulator GlxA family with amidase domain